MNRAQVQMLACALLLGAAAQLFLTLEPAFHVVVVSCVGLAFFLLCLAPTMAESLRLRALACAIGPP